MLAVRGAAEPPRVTTLTSAGRDTGRRPAAPGGVKLHLAESVVRDQRRSDTAEPVRGGA